MVSVLTAQEQRELVRLMKKLGKHAMATYAKSKPQRRTTDAATRQISAP